MDEDQKRELPPFFERDDTIGVADQFDMITKFAMEPNIGHYGYGTKLNHINKNILFTNLKRQHGEPEFVQSQLKNITILKRFVDEVEVDIPTGKYEVVDGDEDKVTYREIFVRKKVDTYEYRVLIDYMSTKVYGITATAAGTDAKLLEILKSTFLHKEQTIEDKTETKSGFWSKMKNKQS